MKLAHVFLPALIAVTVMVHPAISHATPEPAEPFVTCGNHVPAEDCAAGKELVHWVLRRLSVDVGTWRWVLVSRDDWQELTAFYRVPSHVAGFTHLETRTTYLEDVTYALDGRAATEKLPDLGRLAGSARVEWLVSHELGHIACATHEERAADVAASRIRLRQKKEVCRGLTQAAAR